MKNGFIYPIVGNVITLFWRLNLVEYVKMFFVWVVTKYQKSSLADNEVIAVNNTAIDFYVIIKWIFVISVTVAGYSAQWIELFVWYLIATNLFTYFYYHVWGSGFALRGDIDSQRRRYINFLLSIGFYLVCYAYLYQFHYAGHLGWPDDQIDTINSLYLSIANAFTLTYGGFTPLTQTARVLFASELINTFFFFTIIIVNSVPSDREKEK